MAGVLALALLSTLTGVRVAHAARSQPAAAPRAATPPVPIGASTSPAAAAPTDGLARQLTAVFGGGDAYSVAGLDLSTGHSVRAGAPSGMTEASVMKLDLLETALWGSQQGETFDQDDAEQMMDNSDNDAADQIFAEIGGNPVLASFNARLGMTGTTLQPEGIWGLSSTGADDQLHLLDALVSAGSPLTAASRQYALNLMGAVEADQAWGISAAADPGAQTELKDGWLAVDDDDGRWAVNSIGVTSANGHPVLLVVLSQHEPDFQTGIDRVQDAARLLAAALR
ncbi:MAG TPA: serine hydrolase [Jatrophihabitans sp.]|nr:serine hydrolase [Jatrophihabitans sp.]